MHGWTWVMSKKKHQKHSHGDARNLLQMSYVMRDWLHNLRLTLNIVHVNARFGRMQAAPLMYSRHGTHIQQQSRGALWTTSLLRRDFAGILYAHDCSAAQMAELATITQAKAYDGGSGIIEDCHTEACTKQECHMN